MNAIGQALGLILLVLGAWFFADSRSLGRSIHDLRQLAAVECRP